MPTPTYPFTYVDRDGTVKRMPNGSRPISYGVKTNVLTVAFESGYEQRRKKGDPLKSFEFSYNALNYRQYKTIHDFFLDRGGSLEPFIWADYSVPENDKPTYLVKFDMPVFQAEEVSHSRTGPIYKVTLKLQQVFA